jgi:TDG/mug DNA glycosylase family protein
MSQIHSFAPIEDTTAKILILGSMPGKESLKAWQYYAHARNAFWPIMVDLVGAKPALPYESRTKKLKVAGIALWDVLASCIRHSSLDADIDINSIVSNDFEAFLSTHPKVTYIFFNGAMAEKCFHKYAKLTLESRVLHYQRLPSTSPANASMSYNQKLNAWKAIKDIG